MQSKISEDLWTPAVTPEAYGGPDKYQAAILEQYKLYVEMTDRISNRRGLTNTFFLTLNTAVFTLVAAFWKDRPAGDAWLLVFPLAALVTECVTWFLLMRSYRLLNSAKFKVIGELETRLPASPLWSAEWTALGRGKDPRLYLRLSRLEQVVPAFFAAVYLAGFLAVLLTAG